MQTISFTMKSSLVLILLTVFFPDRQQATIDLNSVKQEIDGFGAAALSGILRSLMPRLMWHLGQTITRWDSQS